MGIPTPTRESDQVRPGCDGCLSLSNGVTILVDRRRGSATMSAIARTGAMLLNGQERASTQVRL